MLIILTGPTASGKTDCALDIAVEKNSEIVGADSVQIYRDLIVGAASPSHEDMKQVPHHLVRTLPLNIDINVAKYCEMANKAVSNILKRKKTAVMVGGTNFYVHTFIKGLSPVPYIPKEKHSQFLSEHKKIPTEKLFLRLEKIDPLWSKKISSPNDRQRILRGLEVYDFTGKTISHWHKKDRKGGYKGNFIKIAPDWPRELLYERIVKRTEKMLKNGLIEEVENISKKGFLPENTRVLNSIGYKEVFLFLRGNISDINELRNEIIKNTRRLVKRQLTWLRKDDSITWIPFEEQSSIMRYIETM